MRKIADIPYKPDHTAADVLVGRNWLKEQRQSIIKNDGGANNGIFCLVGGGKIILKQRVGACHASLNTGGYSGWSSANFSKGTLVATITHPLKFLNVRDYTAKNQTDCDIASETVLLAWFDWLTKRSPYSRFIVSTTPKQALNNGLLISTQAPGDLMAALCMISRHPKEYYAVVAGWYDFVMNKGWSEDLAFVVVCGTNYCATQVENGNFSSGSAIIYNFMAGHRSFFGMTKTLATNFCNHQIESDQAPYRQTGKYTEVSGMFDKSAYNVTPPFDVALIKEIERLEEGRKEVAKSVDVPNPFNKGPAASRQTGVPRKLFDKYALQAITNLWGLK